MPSIVARGAAPTRRRPRSRRSDAAHSGRHSGGRRIWQLTDSSKLLVAWRITDESEVPHDVERTLIKQFHEHHGVRPFANGTD
jgi:hypothetical protein